MSQGGSTAGNNNAQQVKEGLDKWVMWSTILFLADLGWQNQIAKYILQEIIRHNRSEGRVGHRSRAERKIATILCLTLSHTCHRQATLIICVTFLVTTYLDNMQSPWATLIDCVTSVMHVLIYYINLFSRCSALESHLPQKSNINLRHICLVWSNLLQHNTVKTRRRLSVFMDTHNVLLTCVWVAS